MFSTRMLDLDLTFYIDSVIVKMLHSLFDLNVTFSHWNSGYWNYKHLKLFKETAIYKNIDIINNLKPFVNKITFTSMYQCIDNIYDVSANSLNVLWCFFFSLDLFLINYRKPLPSSAGVNMKQDALQQYRNKCTP